ncbi:hypothetical protein CEV32_3148 [Brucella rhizosphaerae]|uniref:Uncharacterized protein n=1 Tax=Brucella rhizosphaerae TaxID=571254 RepID=A0A256FV89_9HYPH|nr:hypothetical protein CEV32_3148 [Brucella rhizosphaerae]
MALSFEVKKRPSSPALTIQDSLLSTFESKPLPKAPEEMSM